MGVDQYLIWVENLIFFAHLGGATDQNWKSENVKKNYHPLILKTQKIFFKCIQRSFTTYKKFGSPFFDFEKLLRKKKNYCTPKANSGFWSLLDWNFLSKCNQICPPRDSACWAVYNKSFWSLQIQNPIVFARVLEVNVLTKTWDSNQQ